MLGMRDGNAIDDVLYNRIAKRHRDTAVHHPTIPGSSVNYDWVNIYGYDRVQTYYEPDCSPHPFDIMAIYALYQTVD